MIGVLRVILWVVLVGSVQAMPPVQPASQAEPAPESQADPRLGEPGPRPTPAQVAERTQRIGTKLRCPVCQGSAIGDSPAESAVNMRNRVRELVEQGYSEPQILDYFASKYGEWILLQPRPTGLNWILWLTPAFAAVFGVTWLVLVMQRWRTEPEAPELAPASHPTDPYEAKLIKELDE